MPVSLVLTLALPVQNNISQQLSATSDSVPLAEWQLSADMHGNGTFLPSDDEAIAQFIFG
jgi:hypothetical protein